MKFLAAFTVLMASASATAEVVSASSNGFEVRQTVDLPVKPEVALAKFGEVGAWWDDEHTYSGKAANMRLALEPGGCFCEATDSGGIEHLRVTFVDRPKRVVLTGSLGPLLFEATAGVMDVQVKPAPGGSQLVLDYRAAGFFKGGADKLAPLVDQVLGQQMKRYRAYVARSP